MRLVRKARLFFKEGNSDKVYEVDLCDLGNKVGSLRYLVNFRYGRRGSSLREGTKTVSPVDLADANQIFDSVVVSKTNTGYKESEPTTATFVAHQLEQTTGNNALPDTDKIEHVIFDKLDAARNNALSSAEIKRLVWRIGERGLKRAATRVADLLHKDDDMLDYCIAWSLGRCGDNSFIPLLEQLEKRYGLNHVGRMAREARLHLLDTTQRQLVYTSIKQHLPHSVVKTIETNDVQAIHSTLEMILHAPTPASVELLSDLYTLSLDHTALHTALFRLLKHLPLKANLFKAQRRLFKHAEFRKDADIFAVLAYRFESTRSRLVRGPYSGKHIYDRETAQYHEFEKEIKKEASQLGYISATRDYLRRRGWRSLKRLAELDDPHYVDSATAVLLQFSDDDASVAATEPPEKYDTRHYLHQSYPAFAYFLIFNHLLYANSTRIKLTRNRKRWYNDTSTADVKEFRCEAFPHLWDKKPEALLRLLCESRCAPVHVFAVRAIKTQQQYCAQLTSVQIARLLQQTYDETSGFALQLAQAKIKRNDIDALLLTALLNSPLQLARRAAQDVLNANNQWFLDDHQLFYICIVSPHEDVRLWIRRIAAELILGNTHLQALCGRLIAHVMELGRDENTNLAIINDIGWLLVNIYGAISRHISLTVIEDLLTQGSPSVQSLAARLLLNHATPVEQLPAKLLRLLMEAPSAEVRSLGVQLFGQLPDQVLLQQPDLLVALAVSTDLQVRQAVRPLIARLAARHTEFAKATLIKLMNYLFRAESAQGLHEDILQLVQTDLNHATQDIDPEITWRLLTAKSKAAQRYGAHLLARFRPKDFSVRQLARLAGNPILKVRQWAWQAFETDVARVKQAAQDSLVVLDTDWDDAREFAYRFYQTHFTSQDWNPELLISICDSVRDDVQRFGRELINRFFDESRGIEYLTCLSEHPSHNVQLFASQYLQQYASDNIERLRQLLPYFITVLSQVNRARVAKTRINIFLAEQAIKSHDAARLVAYIYSRQSVTAAITDKSTCIKLLLNIQQTYPDIPTPLSLRLPKPGTARI